MPSLLSISRSGERRFDDESGRRSFDSGVSAGAMGMTYFLASVAMLFGGGLVALLWLRAQYPTWPPPGLPPLHAGFFVATGFLLSVSVALQMASRAVRSERLTRTRRLLVLSLFLAGAFIVLQGRNWSAFLNDVEPSLAWRAAGLLYFLAGLHALHVIGGLVPLVLALIAIRRGQVSAGRCGMIRYTAAYWHLLDVIWIAMLAALLVHG